MFNSWNVFSGQGLAEPRHPLEILPRNAINFNMVHYLQFTRQFITKECSDVQSSNCWQHLTSIPQSNDSTVCGDHDSDHSDHDSDHSDHELALFNNLLCNSSHTLSMKLLFCDYLMLFLPHCDLICFIMNKACLDFNPFQHYPVLQTNFSLCQGRHQQSY